MAFRFTIGVTTYLARLETYFKPLMRRLTLLFPDYEVVVFLNGHYHRQKQIKYLQAATAFLAQYPNVRYVTHLTHQPLARAWNWLILMAAWDYVLILNDDLTVNWEFRHHLTTLATPPDLFTINRSWSHFVIRKALVRQVGWFDENLVGIGYEEYDYIFRLARQGLTVKNVEVHGILNHVAPASDASWADISGVTRGKYSRANEDYFFAKWAWSDYEEVDPKKAVTVVYEPHGREWRVRLKQPEASPPSPYPLDLLSLSGAPRLSLPRRLQGKIAGMASFCHSLYWRLRLGLAAFLRRHGVLGAWWERLKGRLGK